jgi:hypothetical protein
MGIDEEPVRTDAKRQGGRMNDLEEASMEGWGRKGCGIWEGAEEPGKVPRYPL